jgi:hypothetical protein
MPEISTPLAMIGVPVGELLLPHLLAGLHVERDDVVVDGDAVELAVVDDRGAARERAELGDALHARLDLDGGAPDLLAGGDVDREGPLAVDRIEHAVVDDRRREFAGVVHQAGVPERHQALDVRPIDLLQRTVALAVEPHARGQDVVGALGLDDLIHGLGVAEHRP